MLVMAQIAIKFRSVVRRCMRIGRFNTFCFFRKLCRGTVAGDALLHGQGFRFFGLSVAFHAIDIRQNMMMTVRQFTGQAEITLVVAGFASLPVHGFGVGVFIGQHFLLNMAGGAISPFDIRLGHIQFGCGPEKLDDRKDDHDAQ